jgi:NAD-dependent dihydropyrimidine dehydrogenase PreA subunit
MPITIKRYRCKDCAREFDSYKSAKNCEEAHPVPVAVRAVRFTVKPFPYQVEVSFNNGERHIYNADELGG